MKMPEWPLVYVLQRIRLSERVEDAQSICKARAVLMPSEKLDVTTSIECRQTEGFDQYE